MIYQSIGKSTYTDIGKNTDMYDNLIKTQRKNLQKKSLPKLTNDVITSYGNSRKKLIKKSLITSIRKPLTKKGSLLPEIIDLACKFIESAEYYTTTNAKYTNQDLNKDLISYRLSEQFKNKLIDDINNNNGRIKKCIIKGSFCILGIKSTFTKGIYYSIIYNGNFSNAKTNKKSIAEKGKKKKLKKRSFNDTSNKRSKRKNKKKIKRA